MKQITQTELWELVCGVCDCVWIWNRDGTSIAFPFSLFSYVQWKYFKVNRDLQNFYKWTRIKLKNTELTIPDWLFYVILGILIASNCIYSKQSSNVIERWLWILLFRLMNAIHQIFLLFNILQVRCTDMAHTLKLFIWLKNEFLSGTIGAIICR